MSFSYRSNYDDGVNSFSIFVPKLKMKNATCLNGRFAMIKDGFKIDVSLTIYCTDIDLVADVVDDFTKYYKCPPKQSGFDILRDLRKYMVKNIEGYPDYEF